jgi:hypothetical protein
MSDAYGIEAKITADDSGFQQVFSRLETGLGNWGIHLDTLYKKGDELFKSFGINLDQLAGKLGTTGPVLAGMAGFAAIAIEGAKKLGEYLNKVAEAGDELEKMSGKTGMSTDMLQKLKYSVEQTEGSFGAVVSAVSIMTRTLDKNVSTFNALGV